MRLSISLLLGLTLWNSAAAATAAGSGALGIGELGIEEPGDGELGGPRAKLGGPRGELGGSHRDLDGPRGGLLATLPTELRDIVFGELSLIEYATILRTASNAHHYGASDHVVWELLKRAAEKHDGLHFEFIRERECMLRILSSLSTVMHVHYGLHNHLANHDGDQRKATRHIRARFRDCARLSCRDLWKGTCMTGLVRGGTWKAVFPFFSHRFIERHVRYFLFASLSLGDMELFTALKGSISTRMLPAIVLGVAFRGSMELVGQAQEHVPALKSHFGPLLVWALRFGQEGLFQRLLPDVIADQDDQSRANCIQNLFEVACSVGALEVVRSLFVRFPWAMESCHLWHNLDVAARFGHLSVVHFIAVDASGPLRNNISTEELKSLLGWAARGNHVHILKYFFVDSEEPLREKARLLAPQVFAMAAEQAAFGAMEFLLGRDQDGAYWASEVTVPFSSLERIELNNHASVFEHLFALESSDPRFRRINWAGGDNSLLKAACAKGRLQVVQFLLRIRDNGELVLPGIDPGAGSNLALYKACKAGHVSVIAELLKLDGEGNQVYKTVDPGAECNRSLVAAAARGHLKVVQFLLQQRPECRETPCYLFKGIDPTSRHQEVLKMAILERQTSVVKFLLKKDTSGTCIHPGVAIPRGLLEAIASGRHYTHMVRVLLRHPIVNRREEIQLALAKATKTKNARLIQLFMDALAAK